MNTKTLKGTLINEKINKVKGGIYHTSQVTFAYNSNKIEGSKLSKEDTKAIFDYEPSTSNYNKILISDDSLETRNHFKLFDYIIDNIDEPLTKDMLIKMNVMLKKNTTDETNPKYNVGSFKTFPNIIGTINVINTSKPEDAKGDIEKLLSWYNSKNIINIEDIIEFHVRFERIHPFGDGNGRVGRLIMFKECLKNDIFPFIILDQNKAFYIRGLQECDRDSRYLIDTCLDAQDTYQNICKILIDE